MESSDLYRLLHDAFRVLDSDFRRIDNDRSGFLSYRELCESFSVRGVRDLEPVERLISKVDTDHSGELSFAEYVTLLYYWSEYADYESIFPRRDARAVSEAFTFLEKAYIKFDRDRSRKLSRAEVGDFAVAYFGGLPRGFDEECDTVFPQTRGAELSFKLFLMLLYKLTYPAGRYHYRKSSRRGPPPGSSVAATVRMEDTDLYRLLSHAFNVVERDFMRFDADGDGSIDMHEMTNAMKKTDSSELVLAISRLQQLFRDVDVDGSGYIDFSEFLYLVYHLANDGSYRRVVEDAEDAGAVKKAFSFLRKRYTKYDADKSNRLDMGETSAFLKDYFGCVPGNFEDAFRRRMNPTKKTIDLVRFFSLLYEIVNPRGRFVNQDSDGGAPPKRRDNPGRGDIPAPKQGVASASSRLKRIDPLNISEIKKGKELGKGGFGVVYKSEIRGLEVAAKFLLGDYGPDTLKEFKGEVRLMESFDHPNLVFMVGHSCEPPDLCIVTELCGNGSLFDVIQKQGRRLTRGTIIRLAIEIAEGLDYLHTRNPPVIHRDLKSLNVLLDDNFHAKVCDFGMSTFDRNRTHTEGVIGTPCWSSPEVISGTRYDTKADVFSYGVLLWEMTHLAIPYSDVKGNLHQILFQVVNNNLRPRVSSRRCDPQLAELMQDCWRRDPRDRPTMAQVVRALKSMA